MSWGISENASEKEELKAEFNDELYSWCSTGMIDYECYSKLYDACMPILDEFFGRSQGDTE